jgi:hypothetical protein
MNQEPHNEEGEPYVVALTVQFTQQQLDWIAKHVDDWQLGLQLTNPSFGDVVRRAVYLQMQREHAYDAAAKRIEGTYDR